jgi:hypothetical protein
MGASPRTDLGPRRPPAARHRVEPQGGTRNDENSILAAAAASDIFTLIHPYKGTMPSVVRVPMEVSQLSNFTFVVGYALFQFLSTAPSAWAAEFGTVE